MDFTLDIGYDGHIRLLQLTDFHCGQNMPIWDEAYLEERLLRYIRETINRANPDLMIITGDLFHGKLDDQGEIAKKLCNFLDSFAIPWAPIFGNHDRDCQMGDDGLSSLFASAKFCLFQKGPEFGHGNYTIGIRQQGKLIRLIAMTDHRGWFKKPQLDWLKSEMGNAPGFLFSHSATNDFLRAYLAAGYQTEIETAGNPPVTYEIGKDVPVRNGDFGTKNEVVGALNLFIHEDLKAMKIDGYFSGHVHRVNTSVLYDGIRYTFGLKTGRLVHNETDPVGGTLITLNGSAFKVEHLYVK